MQRCTRLGYPNDHLIARRHCDLSTATSRIRHPVGQFLRLFRTSQVIHPGLLITSSSVRVISDVATSHGSSRGLLAGEVEKWFSFDGIQTLLTSAFLAKEAEKGDSFAYFASPATGLIVLTTPCEPRKMRSFASHDFGQHPTPPPVGHGNTQQPDRKTDHHTFRVVTPGTSPAKPKGSKTYACEVRIKRTYFSVS
jgi:hypothetical protein